MLFVRIVVLGEVVEGSNSLATRKNPVCTKSLNAPGDEDLALEKRTGSKGVILASDPLGGGERFRSPLWIHLFTTTLALAMIEDRTQPLILANTIPHGPSIFEDLI